MPCSLYIPHLIPPREIGAALWRMVQAPQLKTLLAKARYDGSAPSAGEAALCRLFGVARQHDWPLAPLLARHENLDSASGYWLCASPVHLETRHNALVLTDPLTLDLDAATSAALAAPLAEHVRGENLTLHAPQPGLWLLHSPAHTPPAMTTSSLDSVSGRDVRAFLPKGADSARWHRILTEMQMLLHAHAANDAREARGQMAVNSVWLWGGGTMPPPAAAPYATVWSDDACVRALAHHTGCRIEPAVANLSAANITGRNLSSESHFFSLEWLTPAMRQGDLQRWSSAVSALNRDWFTPLLAALQARRLDTLTVLSGGDTGTWQFVIHPGDLMKFWRKNKYLQ